MYLELNTELTEVLQGQITVLVETLTILTKFIPVDEAARKKILGYSEEIFALFDNYKELKEEIKEKIKQ